jgi:erythromycin esterase-like protein
MLKILKYLIIILLFFTQTLCAQNPKQLKVNKVGSFSLDADCYWLKEIFDKPIADSVTIVGLGEIAHGGSELFRFKAKMVQYLVEEKGFRNFLFEYPNAAISNLNYYLKLKDRNSMDTVRGLTKEAFANIIKDEAWYDLMVWIKKYNLAHPNDIVNLKGIDIAGATGSFANFFMLNCSVLLEPDKKKEMDSLWRKRPIDSTAKDLIYWYYNHKNEVKERLGTFNDEFVYNLNQAEDWLNYQHLAKTQLHNAGKLRDSIMASNILKFTDKKSIVWAHNMHVTTASYVVSFGNYLQPILGNKYFTVLTDFAERANLSFNVNGKLQQQEFVANKKSSSYLLNKKMDEATGIVFYNDLKNANIPTEVGNIDVNKNYYTTGKGKGFDALMIFKTIVPVNDISFTN